MKDKNDYFSFSREGVGTPEGWKESRWHSFNSWMEWHSAELACYCGAAFFASIAVGFVLELWEILT